MNAPTVLGGRRRAGIAQAMSAGLQQPQPPSISIRAQRFTLVDAAGNEVSPNLFDPQRFGMYLDVVIIGANDAKSRQYYEGVYDPNDPQPPVCFSDNGIAPSVNAAVPQNATCQGCPKAAWGSKISDKGKEIPACSSRKKLAVLVCGDPSQLVYLLNIPPNSLKNLTALASSLRGHTIQDAEGIRPVDPSDLVTRLYFDPGQQGTLLFQPMGYHVQMYPEIDGLMLRAEEAGIIQEVVGANDTPITGALPAPQQAQQLPPPRAMPPVQQLQPPPGPGPTPMQNGVGFAPQPAAQFQQPAPQQPVQQFAPAQAQQPAAQQPAPQPSRRGGRRAGAGRPPGGAAQQPAPQAAPQQFQQPAPQQPVQQFQQPAQQQPPQQEYQPQPPQATVPFQPQLAQPAPADAGGVPPFLARNPDNTLQHPGPVNGQAGAPAFGMAHGHQPNPELAAALNNAFSTPTAPRQR